jgi:hypothetical protein
MIYANPAPPGSGIFVAVDDPAVRRREPRLFHVTSPKRDRSGVTAAQAEPQHRPVRCRYTTGTWQLPVDPDGKSH